MPKLYLCGRDNTEQQTRAELMSVNIHSQFIVLLLENVKPSRKIHTFSARAPLSLATLKQIF